MGEGARVESIDALRAFKIALIKFGEACTIAMGDAEGEVHRTLVWLETEQAQRWSSELRKRTEIVTRCQEAVRSKTVFKDATGSRQSAVEELKALSIAQRRKEEAEFKIVAVKKGARKLQKELESYKGSVQRLSTFVSSVLPAAGANLVNAGLLDSTLMLSLEHLVLVDELVGQIRGATAAATVDADHLALDVIRQEGRPGTNYLGHDHTLEHMKEAMHYSEFTGRTAKSYEDWYDLAHQKVQKILQGGREGVSADKTVAERRAAVEARLKENDCTWRDGQDGWWRFYVQDLV
jgi:hypothetical protein